MAATRTKPETCCNLIEYKNYSFLLCNLTNLSKKIVLRIIIANRFHNDSCNISAIFFHQRFKLSNIVVMKNQVATSQSLRYSQWS